MPRIKEKSDLPSWITIAVIIIFFLFFFIYVAQPDLRIRASQKAFCEQDFKGAFNLGSNGNTCTYNGTTMYITKVATQWVMTPPGT